MSKIYHLVVLCILLTVYYLLLPSSVSAQIFWSTPQKINTSSNQSLLPATTTGPNGYLHTVWTEMDSTVTTPNFWNGVQNPGIFYSYWNGDAWSTPKKVSQNNNFAGFPSIAVTSDNKIHIIWEDDSSNAENSWGRILYSSSTDYGVSWSSPVSIAQSLDLQAGSWSWYPRMVMDSANNLHVSFLFTSDIQTNSRVYYTKYSSNV
ncbi:MAG: sialidase family protein [Candidatus Gottesmanbacteria bacterium]